MTVVNEAESNAYSQVDRAQKGDAAAFESLLARHRADLEAYTRSRIGPHLRVRVEADDVLQETYARAWKSLKRFSWTGPSSFLRWLKGIAEHVILKAATRHRRSQILYVRKDEKEKKQSTPSKELRRGERFDRFEDALNNLKPEYREALVLVRIEGLRIKEAARRMNRTPKAVTHLVARALKKLKESFGDTESLHLPPRGFEGGAGEH